MSGLLIRPRADAGWTWDDGTAHGHGDAAQLATVVRDRRPLLAVPGTSVTLTTTRAPRRNQRAWRQALPFALEDQLAEDVSSLHFALGAPNGAGETPVAVIARARLMAWLDALQAAGISVVAAVPDMLLLPLAPGAWSALVDGDQVLVRSGPAHGFVTEIDALPLLLGRALAETAPPPERLLLWGRLPETLALDLPCQPQPLPATPLAPLQAGLGVPPVLDLLAGSHTADHGLGRWLRPWRVAAILAGLLILAQLGHSVLEYRQLVRARQHLRTAEAALYHRLVPTARTVINPRAQLAGLLRTAAAGNADTGFLALLARSGAVLHRFPQLQLQTLRYQADRLQLDLTGGSLQTLDRLQAQLRQVPQLRSELQVSKQQGTVASRLILRGPAP